MSWPAIEYRRQYSADEIYALVAQRADQLWQRVRWENSTGRFGL